MQHGGCVAIAACFTLPVKFFSIAQTCASTYGRSKSSIWEDIRMSHSAYLGNLEMNAHCRPSSDIPSNKTASQHNSAKMTSAVSPGRQQCATNCFHTVKGSRANAIYKAFFTQLKSVCFSLHNCWYTVYAPPDRHIRITDSIRFTPLK